MILERIFNKVHIHFKHVLQVNVLMKFKIIDGIITAPNILDQRRLAITMKDWLVEEYLLK